MWGRKDFAINVWCNLREADRAAAEAAERKAQVSVLMDTVETLHVGSDSERDQRVVSLTAQVWLGCTEVWNIA